MRGRLLAGLAVLVAVAIASSGWVTLQVAQARLLAVETERVTALSGAVAELAAGDVGLLARLGGVGGIEEVAAIDERQRPLAGQPGGDARLLAALHGERFTERRDGSIVAYGPVRRAGVVVGALRLRVAAARTVGEAESSSFRLLLALTLVDGGLILLFGALFLRQLIRPLEALSRAAARVAGGDLDVEPVAAGPGEIGELAMAWNRMTAALREERARLSASQAQVVAQEKLATVGRLAAGVAHEVGNPLTAVLGYVDLLLLDVKEPQSRDLLERVKAETGRIHRIVHDLLDYARPSPMAREPVRWPEVAAGTVALLSPQPRFRDVAVQQAWPPGLPAVSGSARRLTQLLLNLMWNAADAMGGRGAVHLAARVEGDRVVLTVSDEGPGVAAADAERIFDPFFTTKEPGAGTGLGLAVCRSIVESLGGRIALATRAATPSAATQRGATFEVTLPAWREGEDGDEREANSRSA